MSRQHWILLILVLYLVASLCLGIWSSRISQKAAKPGGFLKNYFIGGRSMGGLVLAMTLVATYTSASSFLGGPGLAASWGLTQSWVAVIQIGTTFLTLGILGKKLGIISRRIGAVTVSDYLRKRYESPFVVILCSVLLVVFFVTQMVAQFIGGATLIQSVTGLSYEAGLALFAGIVILYTVIGGFRAVVMTDTLQGFIMTIGTFLLLFFVIRAGGGMENITSSLDANNPGWNLLCKGDYSGEVATLEPGYLISFWVLVGVGVLGLPQTAVRNMGFKDTQSMHRAMIIGTAVIGVLMIGMHFAGTLAAPLLDGQEIATTDAVIPYVVLNYMPVWAAGLFLAAPLAAVMSTVDSLLILASATIIKDLFLHYGKGKKPADAQTTDRKLSRSSTLLTLALGILTFLVALSPPDIIVWINLFAMGGLEATFFWPLIGGLYWKKGNAACCIASIICGVGVFLFFHFVPVSPFHIHEIVWGLVFGGIGYFAAGKLSRKGVSQEVLDSCF